MTYRQVLLMAEKELEDFSFPDAKSDAWILFEYATGMNRTRFFVDGSSQMPEELIQKYTSWIDLRKKRIPVQHITGKQEFMGMEFAVNEHVLVPRQDTEILVEIVEQKLRTLKEEPVKLLDLCTGSGCIGISLKKRNETIQCDAADISEKALETARYNCDTIKADVRFLQSDMFSNIEGTYHVIVSNPPYIPTGVIEELEEEVRLHDPFQALDGKEDGLFFYRILAKESADYLEDGGWLCMEIGHDQKESVETLLKEAGFEKVHTQKDLAGLDRVVTAMYNKHSK